MFGGINHEQYVGKLHKFKLANNKWWSIDFSAVIYDSENLGTFSKKGEATGEDEIEDLKLQAFAVVDTGTSMMAMPHDQFVLLSSRWKNQINNSTAFSCQQGLCIATLSCK